MGGGGVARSVPDLENAANRDLGYIWEGFLPWQLYSKSGRMEYFLGVAGLVCPVQEDFSPIGRNCLSHTLHRQHGVSVHLTVPKIEFMYSWKRNCPASVPIPTIMCLWATYIFPGSVHIFGCSKIDRPILEIYKFLTDYEFRNWETEHYNSVLKITRLHSFMSGNT